MELPGSLKVEKGGGRLIVRGIGHKVDSARHYGL